MPDAIAIPLDFWQDPQGDVLLAYSERECSIYFPCWDADGNPANFIGHLLFEHAVGARSFPHEYLPYKIEPHKHHSYILRIPESSFVHEHIEYRKRCYPNTRITDVKHYVVVGHDIYHEILADGFTASTIPVKDIQDPRLVRLGDFS